MGAYSLINDTAEDYVFWEIGGIVGNMVGSVISDSYAMITHTESGLLVSSAGTNTHIGGLAGLVSQSYNLAAEAVIQRSYSAATSINSPAGLATHGFLFVYGGNPTLTDNYLYANGSVPEDVYTGLTLHYTSSDMETSSNFTGFTFGTDASAQNWAMPSANPLSPSGLLSPVQYWQCGTNGIICLP